VSALSLRPAGRPDDPGEALRQAATGAIDPSRIVPPSGPPARLTVLTAAAMAFLAVFAIAIALASGRLADRWSDALARTATVRVSAPAVELPVQTALVLAVLRGTPGVAEARLIEPGETRALLEPWLGPDLPLDDLPLPRLIELREGDPGYDRVGLRLRLAAEAPGAVLDDHTRWRRPLAEAALRLRMFGWLAVGLIGAALVAMVTLAARAALAANAQVIVTLRLIGATDTYVARAFVRRFTRRAAAGAAMGTLAGMAAIASLPAADEAGGFLTGLGFHGFGWLWPLAIPPLAGAAAFVATRLAAFRVLRETP
jgi:cell division transport system permease protein